MVWFDLFALACVALSLAYVRSSSWIWIPTLTVALFVSTLWGHLTWFSASILWLLFLVPTLVLNLGIVRRRLISAPILSLFKCQLPRMSETERQALEAGDIWWEGELFAGKPRWSQLFKKPSPRLSNEEAAFFDNQVNQLCRQLDEWQLAKTGGDLPPAVWQYIKEHGFLGIVIPKEFGGLGFSAYAHSTIIMKIATRSVSAAVTIMVPNSLGPAELLQHYGTTAQKQHYLPRLAKGEEIPCFGLTNVTSGSDAANRQDRGVVCKGKWQGEEIVGIRLSFNKRYITLAPIATLLGLAIDLHDPEGLLSAHPHPGITLCLIPLPHEGIERRRRHQPIGASFMNGPVRGRDIFIPADWIIGGVEQAGKGWPMLMECLSIGRAISLPALATASAKLCYRTTSAYAVIRQQFKCSIGQFEGVQAPLARIAGLSYLLEAARMATVGAIDEGVKPSLASAIVKYHATESSRQIVNDAMDIHAGRGVQMGPRNYLAHAYQTLPIGITVEGANILTRNLIIFGQGALRCHPYVRHEMDVVATQEGNVLVRFDALLKAHIGYTLRNTVRSLVIGLTGARWIRVPVKGKSARWVRQLTRGSSHLALWSDIMMLILGAKLKRYERISARLGDVLSHLYLASTAVKYFHDHGEPADEEHYVNWVVRYCLAQTHEAFDDLFANFPMRGWHGRLLAQLLRKLCFPWGAPRSWRKPSDALEQQLAQHTMVPSKSRDRISFGCYLEADPEGAVTRMERTLQNLTTAAPVQKKLQQAVRHGLITPGLDWETQLQMACQHSILTRQEASLLRECEQDRWDALQVDEFPLEPTQSSTIEEAT